MRGSTSHDDVLDYLVEELTRNRFLDHADKNNARYIINGHYTRVCGLLMDSGHSYRINKEEALSFVKKFYNA